MITSHPSPARAPKAKQPCASPAEIAEEIWHHERLSPGVVTVPGAEAPPLIMDWAALERIAARPTLLEWCYARLRRFSEIELGAGLAGASVAALGLFVLSLLWAVPLFPIGTLTDRLFLSGVVGAAAGAAVLLLLATFCREERLAREKMQERPARIISRGLLALALTAACAMLCVFFPRSSYAPLPGTYVATSSDPHLTPSPSHAPVYVSQNLIRYVIEPACKPQVIRWTTAHPGNFNLMNAWAAIEERERDGKAAKELYTVALITAIEQQAPWEAQLAIRANLRDPAGNLIFEAMRKNGQWKTVPVNGGIRITVADLNPSGPDAIEQGIEKEKQGKVAEAIALYATAYDQTMHRPNADNVATAAIYNLARLAESRPGDVSELARDFVYQAAEKNRQ